MNILARYKPWTIVVLVLTIVGLQFMLPQTVSALECSGVTTAVIGSDICGSGSSNPLLPIITFVIKILSGLVGLVAIGSIIYAGILYLSAQDNSGQIQKAKTRITNTIVGVVMFATMAATLNYLIPGGVFGKATDSSGGFAWDASAITKDPVNDVPNSGTNNSSDDNTDLNVDDSGDDGGEGYVVGSGITTNLTLASWNAYNGNSSVASGIKNIMAKGVDIVGLQEMHSSSLRSKVASVASDTIGVQTATKPSSGDKHMLSFPVIYNKTKLAVVGTGYKRLGSIPGLSDRYVVYTKFRVKSSNQTFYFADTHLPPSVEAGGKVSGNSSWIAAYKRMMPVVVSTMKSLKSDNIPLFLVGDFNVNYRRDKCSVSWFPCSSMHSVSMYSAFELSKLSGIPSSYGTHGTGSRLIDYVWVWKRSDTTVKSVSIISGGSGNGYNGSDHKPSLAKVTISTPTKSSTSTAGGNSTGTTGGTSNTGGSGTTGGSNNTGTTGGTGNTSNTVTLSGVVNFRDVAMLNSSVIKPNLLYRSARLKEATDSDITTLSRTLNGGSILDLREAATQKSLPDRPVPGVSHYSFPIDGAASASRYVSVYVNNATYRKQFNLAITHIANSSGPNLIHCTKGRDRTGWLVSMILYILGATDAQVREEYMYTLKAGLSVSVNTLNTGLDAARKNNDGSIMNYITSTDKGLGVSNDTIQKLRAKLGK